MWKALVLPLALLGAACSEQAPGANTNESTQLAEAAIRATGTVVAIDPAAGTVSIDHEPIAAIKWPAMTMQFQAENPPILQGIAVGDRIAFELKSADQTSVITSIEKQ